MDFNIKLDLKLDLNGVNALLNLLNTGPHGLVRPIIDDIVLQAQEQEKAAQAAQAAAAAPTDAEPKTSAEAVI
jgi:hypothetical protein